ncbi:MAG: poly-gamma-glutamate system protein [Myxococcales bacterium]|nr:poly-gamma-glutamate system protein [Myxococcales bacterium]
MSARRRLYWRPHQVSLAELLFLAVAALALLAVVELWLVGRPQPDHLLRMRAATLTRDAQQVIKAHRLAHGPPLEPAVDPMGTGLIGTYSTPVTSTPGVLSAKQTATNPNYAGVVVRDLVAAGVKPGDVVAVGVSGSFPGLNIAVFAACKVMRLDCLVIASATGSQWGANHPDLLWIDMERLLVDAGVFTLRSRAASYGGLRDRAIGLGAEGHRLLDRGIARNGLDYIESESIEAAVDARMARYAEWAGGRPIAAYVNVGGGTASVGSTLGKKMYQPGLNLRPPGQPVPVPAVMDRFARQGVPVLHFTNINVIARKAGLPVAPTEAQVPGEGQLFVRVRYNRWLAAGAALLLFGLIVAVVRTEWGHRLFGRFGGKPPPEQMV